MLKAIDVQQVVMQVEQAEKVQRAEQHHPDMQQRYLDLQAKEEHKLRHQKVPDAEEARKALVRDEQERRQEKTRERAKRVGLAHQEGLPPVIPAEEEQEAQQGGHINIKV